MTAKTLKNKIILKNGVLGNISTVSSFNIIAYKKKKMKHSVIYFKKK